MGIIWFLAMLIIIFVLPSLFSPQIRWINKALGRSLLMEFSECPQTLIAKDSLILIHALHLSLTCNMHVNVCKCTVFFLIISVWSRHDWKQMLKIAQLRLTQILLWLQKVGRWSSFKTNQLLLPWYKKNAHLMQFIRFALTSKTTDYQFPQHAPPLSQLPSKQNSRLILNSCVVLISYWQCVRFQSYALHWLWPCALVIAWYLCLCWLLL